MNNNAQKTSDPVHPEDIEEIIEAIRKQDDEYDLFRVELDAVIAKYGMTIRAVEEGELKITNKKGSVFYEFHDLTGKKD